jgi:hypothetical protein
MEIEDERRVQVQNKVVSIKKIMNEKRKRRSKLQNKELLDQDDDENVRRIQKIIAVEGDHAAQSRNEVDPVKYNMEVGNVNVTYSQKIM